MAMNRIQFQVRMLLHEFLPQYCTEAQSEAALFAHDGHKAGKVHVVMERVNLFDNAK